MKRADCRMKPKVHHLCTLFDNNYLTRVLALHSSLIKHCASFRLYALCMDETSYKTLCDRKLRGIVPIALQELEKNDDELMQAKGNRTRIEYYFTCTPSLPLFVLNYYPEVDLIHYIDADMYLFANFNLVSDEMRDASVGITAHRFHRFAKRRTRFGIYNVGLLSFKRDENGLACLRWWRENCNQWCYDRVEDGRFADQRYLDDWPARFQGVHVFQQKGINVGPWNLGNYRVTVSDGQLWVDDQPLVLFHFARLKEIQPWLYDSDLAGYFIIPNRAVRRHIYGPYIAVLQQFQAQTGKTSKLKRPARPGLSLTKVKNIFRKGMMWVLGLMFRQYIFVYRGRVM